MFVKSFKQKPSKRIMAKKTIAKASTSGKKCALLKAWNVFWGSSFKM